MNWMGLVLLVCGIAVMGCSGQDEEARGGAADAPAAGSTTIDSGAHAHRAAPDTAAPGGGGHAATHEVGSVGTTGDAHGGHAAASGSGVGPQHGRHAGRDAPAHADHAAAADAAHAMPGHMDAADTAHVTHAAADPAHAMPGHMDAADTGHVAHGAPDAGRARQTPVHADNADHDGAHAAAADAHPPMRHEMTMIRLGGGWMAIGMAQAFPAITTSLPAEDGTPLDRTGLYLTQPAVMMNLESPQSRVSFRTTLNFEGLTQPDGELTFGGWGEGYLDKRHPHTLLHEALLSVNVWARDGGGFSLSAGKGFAPYGTDDPMSRPVLKYPTNHHLSQILERWTLNAVYSSPRWSVEAGVFGGNEPTSPWDMSNIESFANSGSARIARRFGTGAMGIWQWELSGSYGYVVEEHDGAEATTQLYNAALRHEHEYSFGRVYYLTEASLSEPEHHDGYWSVLGEASLMRGRHNPYGRVEYATRPEYPRQGAPATAGFFRYDHDDEPIGATRWLTIIAGYGLTGTSLPYSVRPFVEMQWNHVSEEEGGIDPEALFGRSSFFTLSAGVRLFLGGEPMRMGSYGVLDSMTLMHRMQMGEAPAHAAH